MVQVFIIHRWGGTPESDWYPWLKSELENNGYYVKIPEMPDTEEPKIDAWLNKLKEEIVANEKTILIGHSIGCQTILRYLEVLEENTKIKGVIMIAPWLSLKDDALENEEEKRIAKPWIEKNIDFEKVKLHAERFIALFSTNDPFVSIAQSDVFQRKLDCKLRILKDAGHFTENDGVKELFPVFEEIMNIDEKIPKEEKTVVEETLLEDIEYESTRDL